MITLEAQMCLDVIWAEFNQSASIHKQYRFNSLIQNTEKFTCYRIFPGKLEITEREPPNKIRCEDKQGPFLVVQSA